MLSRTIIDKILTAGAKAPSGDNSQPWSFRVSGNVITLIKNASKDNAFLNFSQSGTLIACGAVIENMTIEASCHGLKVDTVLFPDSSNADVVAQLMLKADNIAPDSLSAFIDTRETNRKKYSVDTLPEEMKNKLLAMSNLHHGVKVQVEAGMKSMQKLGFAGSRAEIAILEHQELHQLLFKNVVWTKAEEAMKQEGLFAKTLELSPPQAFMFKLCRRWSLMSRLNHVGFAKFIADDDAKKYATGAAYVAVVTSAFDSEHFVNAGRVMQRAWLFLWSSGYAVHPITATLFFGQRVRRGKKEGLNVKTWELLEDSFRQIRAIFDVSEEEHIMLMLRTGKASPASARSSKKQPLVDYR